MDTKQLDEQYIAHTYARFPIEIVSGHGSLLYDEQGREYIDLGTGIAVNIFGVADASWIKAVNAQMHKVQHTSNLYYAAPCARLAEKLCQRTGMKKVFFGNSGAEANECAIKVARKYAAEKKGGEYYHIITLHNSFHGRTITTLAATGQDSFHQHFLPLTPGFLYADANDLQSVKKLVDEYKVAAILFECVQGEGGVLPLDYAFVQGLAELAAEQDILLLVDEVQTGNGRTGSLYAYMQYNIQPDIVSTAKGLGGGLPLGVCMLGDKVETVLEPGDHGSTFGGNPLSCAGAIDILDRIDESLLEGVKERSAYIFRELSGCKGINEVTGMGLMIGVTTARPLADVVAECREQGVLVLTAHGKMRLLPALNIPMDLLKKAVDIIKNVCAQEI